MKSLTNIISEKLKVGRNTPSTHIDTYQFFPTTHNQLKDIVMKLINEYGDDVNLNIIDVSKVYNMMMLFYNVDFHGDISRWDVSNVTNMQAMFMRSSFNGDISEWDVSNVKSMANIFGNSAFKGDISKWDVSSATDMSLAFYNSQFDGDISGWNINNGCRIDKMLNWCPLSKMPSKQPRAVRC